MVMLASKFLYPASLALLAGCSLGWLSVGSDITLTPGKERY